MNIIREFQSTFYEFVFWVLLRKGGGGIDVVLCCVLSKTNAPSGKESAKSG